MANRFGDEPAEAKLTGRNRFGDEPVESKGSAPQAPAQKTGFVSNMMDLINPLPLIRLATTEDPVPAAKAIWMQPGIRANQAYDAFKRGNVAEGLGRTLQAIPILGGAAEVGERMANRIMAGDLGGAGGAFTGLVGPGFLSRGAGRAMERAAEPIAESSLGIRGAARAYGATPGRAILRETRGLRPETIEKSATQRIGDLTTELENAAQNSNRTASLVPARNTISKASRAAAGANSEATPRELAPLQRQLTEPRPGFSGATEYPQGAVQPISYHTTAGFTPQTRVIPGPAPTKVLSADQAPLDFLHMKRQFDKDFIESWSPSISTKGRLAVAREAYNDMAKEFELAVPGGVDLNQRIQSLIPVAKRAELVGLNDSMGARMIQRFGPHTGSLASALFGLHNAGLKGGALGLAVPEAISAAPLKMFLARGMYGTGRVLGSKPAVGVAAGTPLFNSARRDVPAITR